MKQPHTIQSPSLDFGPLRIPAPILPIAIVLLPLIIRPRNLRRFVSSPAFSYLLALFHILLYIHTVWELFTKRQTAQYTDSTVPFLSYIVLVFGEPARQESNFWLYTSTAVGWILPYKPGTITPFMRDCVSLMLSLPNALCLSPLPRVGVTLSAWALFTRMALRLSLEEQYSSTAITTALLLPIFTGLCYTAISHFILHPRLTKFHYGPQIVRDLFQIAHVLLGFLTLITAGTLCIGLLTSCFPWWRIYPMKPWSVPVWTSASFVGGLVFSAVLVVGKGTRELVVTRDPEVFVQMYWEDCLVAVSRASAWICWVFLGGWWGRL